MTISDYRSRARRMLADRWGLAIGVTLLACLLGAAQGFSLNLDLDAEDLQLLPEQIRSVVLQAVLAFSGVGGLLGTVQFIIGGVVRLGYCRFWLKMYDEENPEVHDLFSRFNRFGDGFLLALLTALFTVLWSLLLIIPGIVAGYSYAMAPYIMEEDPGMGPREAIRSSKDMMRGHKMELFLLDLSFIGWALLSILTLGIGYFWLTPYQEASRAAFYRNLSPKAIIQAEEPVSPWTQDPDASPWQDL